MGRFGIVVMIAFLLGFSSELKADIQGRWIHHPAASLRSANKESQIDRILEGEKYVYFSVRGSLFNRDNTTAFTTQENIDPLQIFRYDKTKEWSGENIVPLANEHELSGSIPTLIEYSPEKGVLVLAYENNIIDFIFDDGTRISSKTLCDVTAPGTIKLYSVTFDEDSPRVYVAGNFGFATVDSASGELYDIVKTDKEVAWAARVGTNMVLFAGKVSPKEYSTSTYVYPVGGVPSTLTDSKGGSNLQWLMPVKSNSFAAMAPGADDTKNVLTLYTISGSVVGSEALTPTLSVDNGALPRFRHLFRTDGYVARAKGGYAIHSQDAIYLLNKVEGRDGLIQKIAKPSSITAGEKASKCSTYDGSKVWLYTYDTSGNGDTGMRGFYSYDISGDSWTGKSAVNAPSAPTGAFPVFGVYNPEYGLMLRGPGTYFNEQEGDLDRLNLFTEGKWSDLSYAAHNPKYVGATSNAKFLNFDPLNPRMIWGNSNRVGLHRMDLEDYNKYFCVGCEYYSRYKDTYPGYYPIMMTHPNIWWYYLFNSYSTVDFDAQGTMWFMRFWWNDSMMDYEDLTLAKIPLYYITAQEREALDSGVVPDIQGREINIPRNANYFNSTLYTLKAPGNENYLMLSGLTYSSNHMKFTVYDHNGTPGDTSDDRYGEAEGLVDERGERIGFRMETGMYEDPLSGNVWLLTTSGPYIINPKALLAGDKSCRRVKVTRSNGSEASDYPFEYIPIKYITDDRFGRKWLATENGLYCLAPDAQEILGHYTESNSPLLSDDVFNVIYNPENGSLMVLTSRGICEFYPEDMDTAAAAGTNISIWPSSVNPSYNGYVNISGVENGTEYVVCDKGGTEICSLGKPESGKIQWNMRNASGKRVSPGRYIVKRKGKDEVHYITVM